MGQRFSRIPLTGIWEKRTLLCALCAFALGMSLVNVVPDTLQRNICIATAITRKPWHQTGGV
ncbi:hypothetical protein D3OALGB2SA_4920 [Olavius algarvensis associated proteobacterium Delta 3]|nr:hypothetical protein D3OALGB2SA_4920 [Olavius algarvensis associated proteobacterium Delta 3]